MIKGNFTQKNCYFEGSSTSNVMLHTKRKLHTKGLLSEGSSTSNVNLHGERQLDIEGLLFLGKLHK